MAQRKYGSRMPPRSRAQAFSICEEVDYKCYQVCSKCYSSYCLLNSFSLHSPPLNLTHIPDYARNPDEIPSIQFFLRGFRYRSDLQ